MTAEISRRLENLIRLGTIAEVDYQNAKARVKSGAILTDFLPFATARAGDVKTWTPPSIGEQVFVFSMSGELTNGVILTGIYQQSQAAPSQNGQEHLIVFPDGAEIRYNHKSGALHIKAVNSLTIDCPQITLNGNVELNGTLKSTGDQVAGTISQINHVHSGVMTGAGKTQKPS